MGLALFLFPLALGVAAGLSLVQDAAPAPLSDAGLSSAEVASLTCADKLLRLLRPLCATQECGEDGGEEMDQRKRSGVFSGWGGLRLRRSASDAKASLPLHCCEQRCTYRKLKTYCCSN